MTTIDLPKAADIRNSYISAFVDINSTYYMQWIQCLKQCSDGLCYYGYLWDCLKDRDVISLEKADQFLFEHKDLYIMWDIHSSDKILISDYWKHPKHSVLLCDKWKGALCYQDLPEDIYVFDASFSWSVIFTHEYDENDKRYCFFSNKC